LLAERKLATWRWTVQQPVCRMGENTMTMVVMPTLAHQEPRVLAAFVLVDHAAECLGWQTGISAIRGRNSMWHLSEFGCVALATDEDASTRQDLTFTLSKEKNLQA
jgi:hypothetical protein